MAYSVDWSGTGSAPSGIAYEIYIPKADLTLIQVSPTEIRELDVDVFRLTLKDLEDDLDGRPWPKTHVHDTETLLGGIAYARKVQIIAPYTVTFEDGQYAVNLVGANNNILDVTNKNQVSVNPSNSAGLISLPDVEYGAFENAVHIDEANISGRAISGTIGGAGKPKSPSDNLEDAKLIDDYRGFGRYQITGHLELDTAEDFSCNEFVGLSHVNTSIHVASAPNTQSAVFRELEVSGVLDGSNAISQSIVHNLTYFNGHVHESSLRGDILLRGGADALLANCNTLDSYDPPVIDMGGSGQNLSMPNYSGLVTISNMSGAFSFAGVGLQGGQVKLDSTSVTGGMVWVSGPGQLVDETDAPIPSGVWNGGVLVINGTLSNQNIAHAVWDTPEDEHQTPGTFGRTLSRVRKFVAALLSNL